MQLESGYASAKVKGVSALSDWNRNIVYDLAVLCILCVELQIRPMKET